ILKDFSKTAGFEVASFNDFGINTSANTYFYYSGNDSLSYVTLVAPLQNTQFLNHFAANEGTKVTDNGNFRYVKLSGGNYLAWDEQKLLVIDGTYVYSYFNDYDFSAIEAEVAENPEKFENLYETFEFETAEDLNAEDADAEIYEESPAYDDDVVVDIATPEAPPTASTEEITRDYIPYLYNYQLQLYADSFYEFCETIKDAANNSDGSAIEDLQYQVEE